MSLLCVACWGAFLTDSALPDGIMAPQCSVSECQLYARHGPTCPAHAHLFDLPGPDEAGSGLSPIVQMLVLRLWNFTCQRTFSRDRAAVWTRSPAVASWARPTYDACVIFPSPFRPPSGQVSCP